MSDRVRAGGPTGWIAVAVGAIVALNLLILLGNALTSGGASGPPSSSLSTSERGLAGYAALLAQAGHPVSQQRSYPSQVAPDVNTTLMLVDPGEPLPVDVEALAAFVDAGGRLIVAGRYEGDWLEQIVDPAPSWGDGGARIVVPSGRGDVRGIEELRTAGEGIWTASGAADPALPDGRDQLLLLARRGRVALLADPSPLENRLLGEADNAALALALAGDPGRPVRFAESYHGYAAEGLDAIPENWKLALVGLALAALVWIAARARRIGPPQESRRRLPPPRAEYVDALASILARTSLRDAAAPVASEVSERIAARASLGRAPDERMLRGGGERLGLSAGEIDAVVGGPRSEREAVAAGTALSKLTRGAP